VGYRGPFGEFSDAWRRQSVRIGGDRPEDASLEFGHPRRRAARPPRRGVGGTPQLAPGAGRADPNRVMAAGDTGEAIARYPRRQEGRANQRGERPPIRQKRASRACWPAAAGRWRAARSNGRGVFGFAVGRLRDGGLYVAGSTEVQPRQRTSGPRSRVPFQDRRSRACARALETRTTGKTGVGGLDHRRALRHNQERLGHLDRLFEKPASTNHQPPSE
jgi:hypothetical protein